MKSKKNKVTGIYFKMFSYWSIIYNIRNYFGLVLKLILICDLENKNLIKSYIDKFFRKLVIYINN